MVVFAIHSHESATGVHVFPIPNPLPPPSLPHPSRSSQGTSPEHPISCIKPGLGIYFTYGNIHVSILSSQIIPPSRSPPDSKSSLHLHLFCCLTYRVIVTLSKFHIYALIYCIGVFFLTYFTLYNSLQIHPPH